MPEDRMNSQPLSQNEENENAENERFESDTQKIVRRHLENKDDMITHEDIANVRIGMVPPEFDAVTEASLEGGEALEEVEKELLDEEQDTEKNDENPDKGQITPWDTIDPEK